MKLIYIFLLFNIFVKKYGGMTIAIKVEFLRNISFFLYHSWVFTTKEEFQEIFSIFYTNVCVYQQAKDFIDDKLVLKKKNQLLFTRNILSQRDTQAVKDQNL